MSDYICNCSPRSAMTTVYEKPLNRMCLKCYGHFYERDGVVKWMTRREWDNMINEAWERDRRETREAMAALANNAPALAQPADGQNKPKGRE